MANDRLKFAIGRLERSAARVERLVMEARPVGNASDGDPHLVERHELLRQHMRSAIGRIDALIVTAGR